MVCYTHSTYCTKYVCCYGYIHSVSDDEWDDAGKEGSSVRDMPMPRCHLQRWLAGFRKGHCSRSVCQDTVGASAGTIWPDGKAFSTASWHRRRRDAWLRWSVVGVPNRLPQSTATRIPRSTSSSRTNFFAFQSMAMLQSISTSRTLVCKTKRWRRDL